MLLYNSVTRKKNDKTFGVSDSLQGPEVDENQEKFMKKSSMNLKRAKVNCQRKSQGQFGKNRGFCKRRGESKTKVASFLFQSSSCHRYTWPLQKEFSRPRLLLC